MKELTQEDAHRIARVCHEVNRAYCAAIGDASQVAWEDAPDWQRRSAVAGVVYVATHADARPDDTHRMWLADKEREGWKYGPVKDPITKEHPCFVEYDKLPPEQRVKDYLFLATVRALLT